MICGAKYVWFVCVTKMICVHDECVTSACVKCDVCVLCDVHDLCDVYAVCGKCVVCCVGQHV